METVTSSFVTWFTFAKVKGKDPHGMLRAIVAPISEDTTESYKRLCCISSTVIGFGGGRWKVDVMGTSDKNNPEGNVTEDGWGKKKKVESNKVRKKIALRRTATMHCWLIEEWITCF